MNVILRVVILILPALLLGCTTINSSGARNFCLNPNVPWGIATFTNNTDVPQAGLRAMSITAGILRGKGLVHLAVYQPKMNCNQLIICPNKNIPFEKIRSWAYFHNIRYMMIGAVNEWQYKVGLDGEPVASVALQVYDVGRNQIVWSSVGSKTGSSHTGLSNTAQNLIDNMLKTL